MKETDMKMGFKCGRRLVGRGMLTARVGFRQRGVGGTINWIMVLLVVGFLSTWTSTTLGAGPSTRPATRPVKIEQLVEVPKYTLATKGKHPREAFEMLAKASGMKIVTNISDSPVGKKPRKALWDYEYREVDFDLNGVCLLEAIGRLARHSRLYGLFEHPDVIALRPRDTKNVDDEWVLKPLSEAEPMEAVPVCYSGGVDCEPSFGDRGLTVDLSSDPTMMICGRGRTVIEEIVDERGEKIMAKWDNKSRAFVLEPKVETIGRARGYVPVLVATKVKTVEIPLKSGAMVNEGGWEIEVVDFDDRYDFEVFWGMEWQGEMAELTDISPFFGVKGEGGALGVENRDYNDGDVRPTVTGGVRQRVSYKKKEMMGLKAIESLSAMIHVPLEIKEAAVGFEFEGVKKSKCGCGN